MMDQEKKALWVAALRSGDYPQGKGSLHTVQNGQARYCCLGVLCDVAVKNGLNIRVSDYPEEESTSNRVLIAYAGYDDFLPNPVMEWAGLESRNPGTNELVDLYGDGNPIKVTLSYLNDNGRTLSEIADIIERDL